VSAGEQWAKVPESVAYADLDATALNVLIIMAAKAGRDRVTWITQRTMGERLELDRTTIGRTTCVPPGTGARASAAWRAVNPERVEGYNAARRR